MAEKKLPSKETDLRAKQKTKEALIEAKDDPSVKEALKKEQQPAKSTDLSPIHNTEESGTTGGDQRVPKNEKKNEIVPVTKVPYRRAR
ncbi:MAG: hypothetical protein ABIN01_18075 [Ferruginibacter sp.]